MFFDKNCITYTQKLPSGCTQFVKKGKRIDGKSIIISLVYTPELINLIKVKGFKDCYEHFKWFCWNLPDDANLVGYYSLFPYLF